MVAIDRLIPHLAKAETSGLLAGNAILIPRANPIGLAQAVFGETLGRFDLNSRINFNRSFPAETADRITRRPAAERLKATLLTLAINADIVLDLRCDDEGPVYLYVSKSQLIEGRRLAQAMQATVILADTCVDPNSFNLAVGARWSAQKRDRDGCFAATIELRGMQDVTPKIAEQDAEGLCRYLVDVGSVFD